MTKRIFNAIIMVAAAVLLLSFLIIMDVLYGSFSAAQREQLRAELALAAHGVEQGGASWLSGLDMQGYRLTLVAQDGGVLFDSQADPTAMENHMEREEIKEALEVGSGESSRMSATLTEKTLYQATRLGDGTVLRISVTQRSILALTLGMLTPVLIVLAAAIVLAALLASRLSKRIVKPLNELDLENPLDNDAYPELSPLLTRIARQGREIGRQLTELERKQDEFSAITGSMSEGLVLLNEKGAIVSINPAARALFRAEADCAGEDFLTVERGREIQCSLEAARVSGHGEAALEREGRSYQIDASRILSGGETTGLALLAFDITDRVQAERLRREFTANVSHELKTPLQSIMGSAELMENGLVQPGDLPRFSGRIRAEAARMVTLIDDIIRLSQLDEGGGLQNEPVELLAAVRDAAGQLSDAAAARNVSLSVSGEEIVIPGVRRLLHEIAFNLMDNAIKYNREGGSVFVSVKKTETQAVLTVADTGIGIPKEQQSRVFERFYRVDKSHSKATGGTGLGLSIVKHAVEAQHGELALTSEPGKGATVTVRFPL